MLVYASAQEPHQIVFWAAWLAAPTARLGREKREATGDICWGHTAAQGAVAAGSEGKGWGRSRGGEREEAAAFQGTAPQSVVRWGSRWAQGEVKGRELSCGLRSRAQSQCGYTTRRFKALLQPGGGGRGQAALVTGQDGLRFCLERRVQPPLPPQGREPQSQQVEDGPSPRSPRPRSREVKVPEQPDSPSSLLPAVRAPTWARPPPWGRRGPVPREPPRALHPLPLPGSAAAGAREPGASAALRPASARAGPRRRSACSASESCCCSRRSLAPLAPPPLPPPPLPSQDNSQYGGARLPPLLLPAGHRARRSRRRTSPRGCLRHFE